uniref:COP9 signalosome subunit 7B n=1 Tax=Rousettus aegyptiacus TaxID=9407 RepID=A0A7J8JBR4_ROUAE|nr:COP9 signalosome subunit 7B [Rousettus aegyptiacus]
MAGEQKPSSNLLEQFILLAKGTSGSALTALISQVLEAPGVYVFGELLELANVQELAEGANAPYLQLLNLFAYGTYPDYIAKQMNNHKWNKKACLSSGRNCHQMNFSNMLEEKKNQFGFTCLESRTVDKEPKAFGPCLLSQQGEPARTEHSSAEQAETPPLSTCSEFQTCPAPQQRLPTLLVLFQKNRSPLSLARALLPQCSLQTQGLHRCHPDGVRHYPAGFRRGRSRLCLRARLCPSFFFVPCHVVRLVGSRRQL